MCIRDSQSIVQRANLSAPPGGGPPGAYRGVHNLVKPSTDWRPPLRLSLRRLSPRRGLPSEEASNH
eukprot:6565596-Alexandrium_andersonii.AAC.1